MASPNEATIELKNFAGVNEAGDGWQLPLRFAMSAENVDTTAGVFRPMRKGVKLAGELPAPIGTLARLYRRFHSVESEKEVLIAAAGGSLYYRLLSGDTWTLIDDGFSTDNFDYVTYETTVEGETVDILLLTNALDGMYCVYGNDMSIVPVTTPHKFGVLARHAERIWGAGIIGEPDLLVYSTPYDPFNWDANPDDPAEGAGDVQQPSWDGDSFVALRPFGDQLLAIKKHRIWRILGLSPGEYVFKEQFGGGTVEENTVVVYGSAVYMLAKTGLALYDGADVAPYRQDYLWKTMEGLNLSAVSSAYAAMWGRKYLLALPMNESLVNNMIVVHDTLEGTFNFMTGVDVKALLALEDRILYTTNDTPGTVWELGAGEALPVSWESGPQPVTGMNSLKNNFDIYLIVDTPTAMNLTVGIETERKVKTKEVFVRSGVTTKRITINNSGRWVKISLASETRAAWCLVGGLRVTMELDHD